MAAQTTPIKQLITDFVQVFSQDFMEVNLQNQLGYRLMTEYEVNSA